MSTIQITGDTGGKMTQSADRGRQASNDRRSLDELKELGAGRPAPDDVVLLYHQAFREFGTQALCDAWVEGRKARRQPTRGVKGLCRLQPRQFRIEREPQLKRPILLHESPSIQRPVLLAIETQLKVIPPQGDADDPV